MSRVGKEPQWESSWSAIKTGQFVRLRQGKDQYITGVFDTKTDDGSVVWVHMSDGAGRRLIHCDDGYLLMRPDPNVAPGGS